MLLTIAIPSNNKTYLLEEAIDSIITDPEFGHNVDIVISDNTTTTATLNLYQDKYSDFDHIHYFKSTQYDSLDSNVHRAVEISCSPFVWIFGDDDLLIPGALSDIVIHLLNCNPAVSIVNSSSFTGSRAIESSRISLNRPSLFKRTEDDLFLICLGGYITYVASIIVQRSLWLKHYRHSLIGSYFAHLDTVLSIKYNNEAYFIARPCIKMRVHTQTWKSHSFRIWNVLLPQVVWSHKNYSDNAKNSVVPKYPLRSLPRMLAARAYGHLNYHSYNTSVKSATSIGPITKFTLLCISILPRQVFTLLYILYIRALRSKPSTSFSPNLALAQLSLR